jgi:hypothetical protein
MTSHMSISLLAVALAGGLGLAAFRSTSASGEPSSSPPRQSASSAANTHPALPPNHPPIGSGSRAVVPSKEAPAITWTEPADWERTPNLSPLRLATYRTHGASGAESAELTVVRAGGTTEANVKRWLDAFDDMGKETQTEMEIHGMKVTVVETSGTFTGGSMGPSSTRREGWALLAGIVETPGSHYFFKMTGPRATVAAARPSLLALLNGIAPIT